MDGSESSRTPAGGTTVAEGTGPRPLHARSFKLRFATQREPGRSYVSLVKPLGLPATVTGKFYRREDSAETDEERTERALRRIRDMFASEPRREHAQPLTSSQVYGWHAERASAGGAGRDPRLERRIRDSTWLKERLRVLAADDKLKQR